MVTKNRMGRRLQVRGKIVFKSIFEQLFWTQIFVLLLVFVSISITMSVFMLNYATQRQYMSITNAGNAIERITTSLYIENNSIIICQKDK